MSFPKIYKKIEIKKKTIKCSKYDDLRINCKPHFIKIDSEGFDGLILKGLKKTIKLHKPVILTEYNKEYFDDIIKILKNYIPHVYDIKNDKMLKLNSNILKSNVSRSNKKNFLSIRNIYFLPKDFK
jgi:transcriptional antiterminator Rof (Rho-off)